ncbi:hypothetical protein BH10PLA2_BH10PLA2_04270 [soil metagenome]
MYWQRVDFQVSLEGNDTLSGKIEGEPAARAYAFAITQKLHRPQTGSNLYDCSRADASLFPFLLKGLLSFRIFSFFPELTLPSRDL